MEYNENAAQPQGRTTWDPETRRDLPMLFRWRVPAGLRDLKSLPWTGDAKRNHAVAGIVAEALSISGTDRRISVSLNRNWYPGRERIVGAGYTYTHVRGALTTLQAGGWLDVVKGIRREGGSGVQTTFAPTPQLTDYVGERALVYGLKDPIIVRDETGAPMPGFANHYDLARVRKQLARANEAFGSIAVGIDAPDVVWTPDKPMVIDGRWYDPRRTTAHAVYNLTATQGGRWYGLPYQTLSNRVHGRRAQLTMDGCPVDEPDFGGCHPRMLYHERGVDPDGDELYDVPHDVYGRDEIKLAVQIIINADNERDGIMGFAYRLAAREAKAERDAGGPLLSPGEVDARAVAHLPDARRLFDALRLRHAVIEDSFFTGSGRRLQNTETQIMVRASMACLDRGVVVMPMHDSAIAKAGKDADTLREEMMKSYVSQTGKTPKIG